MARNRKTDHPIASSDIQAPDEQGGEHQVETTTAQCQAEDQEASMTTEVADILTAPPETAQEVWESLREEFYEQIEQLPLSLHRSFALIREQDKEVQACQAELLPTIRSYVRLRQSIQVDAQRAETQAYESDSQFHHRANSRPSSVSPDPSIHLRAPYVSEEVAEHQSNGKPNRSFPLLRTGHKEEELDITMDNVASRLSHSPQRSREADLQSPKKSTLQGASNRNVNKHSQSGATSAQGLREADATVPKSVPFPPRPKPKTSREILTRISFLTGELLRASEEKVGLAAAACDSIDRHLRALDVAIREQDTVVPGLGERMQSSERVMQEGTDAALNEGEGEDDEEPQLGMIGPLAETCGSTAPRSRRNRKRNRVIQDPQNQNVKMQTPTHVHVASTTTHQELVDPHEPRYCYCNQVSYGEMIACDNPDCSREWFHLGCVGLTAPPKGRVKWYCRDCEELLGSNRRRRIH